MISTKQLSVHELQKRFTVERVSPSMAKVWLANQGPQRNARVHNIKKYASDMSNGE